MNPLLRKRMAPRATRMEQSKVPPMPTLRELAPDTVRRFPDLLKFDAALTQWRERLMSLPVEDQLESATAVAEAIAAVPQVPGPKGDKGDPGESGPSGPRGNAGPPGSTSTAASSFVPMVARTGEIFTVPMYRQALFSEPIIMEPGTKFIIETGAALIQVPADPVISQSRSQYCHVYNA